MIASSTAASALDVTVLIALCHLGHLAAGAAAALGALAGGALNFALTRRWVFRGGGTGRWWRQAAAYGVLVVLCGALLSGLIVQLWMTRLGGPVLLAKLGAAALVLLGWNYPIASRVVFARA
jgi:putative flippase GtrA